MLEGFSESAPEQGVQGWRTRTSSRSRGCMARSPIFGPSRARRARAPPPPAAGTSRERADSPGSPGGGRRLIGSPRGRRRGGPRPGYWPPADPLCRAVGRLPESGIVCSAPTYFGPVCGYVWRLTRAPVWTRERGLGPGVGLGPRGGARGRREGGRRSGTLPSRPREPAPPAWVCPAWVCLPRALEPGDRTAPGRALAWKPSPAVPCSTRAPASPPCRSKALFLLLCKPKVFIVP